jgi:hypothetical protein
MANWEELKAYLLSNLDAEEKSPRLVAATLKFPDGSSQVTLVSFAEDYQGSPWVSIDSLVSPLASVDLIRAVRLAGEKVCGGMATLPIGEQEYLVLRHAMPISDLDSQRLNDFIIPFYAVSGGANSLAKELSSFNSL